METREVRSARVAAVAVDAPRPGAAAMESDNRLSIERLYCARASIDSLHAHSARICVQARGGQLMVCSGDGSLEFASSIDGAHIQSACWSPCGSFLIFGDGHGQIRLLHVPSQTDIVILPERAGEGAPVFREMRCQRDASNSSISHLLALTAGQLLNVSNLHLSQLHAELRASLDSLRDHDGSLEQAAISALQDQLIVRQYPIHVDTRCFCVSAISGIDSPFSVYLCAGQEVHSITLWQGRLHSDDAALLPNLHLADAEACDGDVHAAVPAGDVGGAADSPTKRRRLSGLSWQEQAGSDQLMCFTACGGDSLHAARSTTAHDVGLAGEASIQGDPWLAFVFRRPGLLVLYDVALLFEIYRWRPRHGEDIVAAVPVRVPAVAAGSDAAAEVLAGVEGPPTANVSASFCFCLDSGELQVCTFPAEQVLFSVRLDGQSACKSISSVLIAEPCNKNASVESPSASSDGWDTQAVDRCEATSASQVTLAFVTVVAEPSDGGSAGPEAILSAVRCCVEENTLDRSADLDDMLMEHPEQSKERSVHALRKQMMLFMEQAAQGKIELQVEQILQWAKELMRQIPGFVIGSIIRAQFPDLRRTREVLQGVVQLLQSEALPSTYDKGKGVALVTDVLNKLSTLEYLHSILANSSTDYSSDSDVETEKQRTLPIDSPTRPSLTESFRDARSRRLSLPMPNLGSSPSRNGSDSVASRAKRRHSTPCDREVLRVRQFDLVGRSVVQILAGLPSLEGSRFAAVWQHFRRAQAPQVCSDLIAVGRLAEAFTVASRHSNAFQPEGLMALLDSLPVDLVPEQEERLPFLIVQHVMPLLTCRESLVRWVFARAELLESRHQEPDAALHLLGTVILTAVPHRCGQAELLGRAKVAPAELTTALCNSSKGFPESHLWRHSFWAGSLAPASLVMSGASADLKEQPHTQHGDWTTHMLTLLQQLLVCAQIQKAHGLRVSLKELRAEGCRQRVVTKLLDRVVAPELLLKEVRVHVAPFCAEQGLCCDEALQEYVMELAETLGLPNGGVRLQRAANVSQCISNVECRATCLIELLRHWRGAEVPVELRPLVDEAESWPTEQRERIQQQLVILNAQRLLTRYGLCSASTTHTLQNERLVQHLLSRREGGNAPLQDALSILSVFPQTFTRAEVIFLSLTHVVAAAEAEDVSIDALCNDVANILSCAGSISEHVSAVRCFAHYCIDILGDSAACIALTEKRCRSSVGGKKSDCRKLSFGDCDDSSYTQQAKAGSATVCAVAVRALQRAALLQHRGAVASGPGNQQWADDGLLDLFMRLQRLQQEFGVFVDPGELPMTLTGCTAAIKRTSDVGSIPHTTETFRQHAAELLSQLVSEWRARDQVNAQGHCQLVADDELGKRCTLTKLLRLGAALGLEPWQVHEEVIGEAMSEGLFSACRTAIAELLQSQCAESSANLVGLVKRLLRHLCEHVKAAHRPTEMIHQLTQLEESVVSCISACSAEDLAPLLELAEDIHFVIEVLLSSDMLDMLVDGKEARSHLKNLPVSHRHHLGYLDYADATMQTDAFNVDIDIFPNVFSELQCQLMAGPAARQATLDYLSVKHQAECQLSLEAVLSNVLELLRPSECVELATALMLRHPSSLPKAVLLQMCRDRSSRVLRAGNLVDHQLAAAYLGCLEQTDALEVFSSSLSYMRPGANPLEHQRVLQLVQLGADLSVLWGNSNFHAKMLQIRSDPKWRQTLILLDVPFDGTKFDIRLSSDRGSSQRIDTRDVALSYKQSLLSLLIKASHFDLGLALQYGNDYRIPDEEVIALWVELCLTMPNSAAALPASELGSGEAVMQAFSASLKEQYRLQVPPVLAHLPSQVSQELLYTRVLPLVSPYDYGRISFILGLLDQHPQVRIHMAVLRTLQTYTRRSPPTEAEMQQISAWISRLQKEQHPHKSETDRAADEAKHLARHCLPWHAIAQGQDAWATLELELCNSDSVEKLLPLCALLGLDPDDFYICHMRHLEQRIRDKPDADLSQGSSNRCTAKDMLIQMRDPRKALDVAESLEHQMPLGPEQISIAQCREQILQRATSGHYMVDVEVRDMESRMCKLHAHICLLESRWDLEKAGLTIFQEVLVQHGVKACVTSMYFYLPVLLMLSSDSKSSPSGLKLATSSARKMGPLGLHKLVDILCIRHDLTSKNVRHQLMEQWIMNPQWVPEHIPNSLLELNARAASMCSGDLTHSHGLLQKTQLMHAGQSLHMFFQTPADLICLERVVFLAWPRHDSKDYGGSSSTPAVPKEVREDAKVRSIFLLRTVFNEKRDKPVPFHARSRALTVLFRIAPKGTIERAYRNSLEELQAIWKTYIYMDAFERLGAPQDFKRLFQCNKEGLARSLWRSRQADPCMVQVIASLCLDFKVIDSHFWAAILTRLHAAQFHSFLRDVLAAMHEHLASEMPYDPNFVAVLRDLVRAPVDAVAAWCQAAGTGAVPSLASWLPLLPYVLRQSPFIAELDPSGLARQLLSALRSPSLPVAASSSLVSAVLGQGMHHSSEAASGGGADGPAASEQPRTVQLLCLPPAEAGHCLGTEGALGHAIAALEAAEQVADPSSTSGPAAASNSTAPREIFGELAVEIACCDASLEHLEAFVREEIVGHYPDLIFPCLLRRAGNIRQTLFRGILEHRLSVEARTRMPKALFSEFVEYAVATMDIAELMEAAIMHGEPDNARRLLVNFSQTHCLPMLGDLLMGRESAEGGEAAEYLRKLCGHLRESPKTGDAFRDFAQRLSSLAEDYPRLGEHGGA